MQARYQVIMNRDHRKISRSLEEGSILASTDHLTPISQTDNELRQKLEAIKTSHKLSNKRIKQETRELKKILHDLQKELKVSKGTHGRYIPSLLDQQPQRGLRRTTVSSVPLEDRKEASQFERDQQGRVKKGLNHDFTRRRRSGSFPPISQTDSDKNRQSYCLTPSKHDENTIPPKPREELQFRVEQLSPCTQPEKAEGSQLEGNQGLVRIRSPYEQQQQSDHEKEYLAAKICGKFARRECPITSSSPRSLYQSPQLYKTSAENRRETRSLWQKPDIVDEYSIKSNQNELRKKRLSVFQNNLQSKGSIGSKEETPKTTLHGKFDTGHDPEYAPFDSLPAGIVGGRRLSAVTHGRVRKTSRTKGLPPLKEEKTRTTPERTTAEVWSDLANCRYLRKEEKELSMDDIFGED